jgi:hypothetical protein
MARLRDKMRNSYIAAGVPAALAQQRADVVLSQGTRFLRL